MTRVSNLSAAHGLKVAEVEFKAGLFLCSQCSGLEVGGAGGVMPGHSRSNTVHTSALQEGSDQKYLRLNVLLRAVPKIILFSHKETWHFVRSRE